MGTSALPFTARFVRWSARSPTVQPCVDSYRARYRELAAGETTVFPGILGELLNKLAEHLPLATSPPPSRVRWPSLCLTLYTCAGSSPR